MTNRSRPRVEPLEDRLTPAAGSLDPTFGAAGIARFTSGEVERLAALPDGRILALVANTTAGAFSLERFEPDGTPDPTFGTGGVAALPALDLEATLTALPDGGALVGHTTSGFSLLRVTSAGAIDTTFGTGGTAVVPLPAGTEESHLAAVVVQTDGRILVAGDETPDRIITGQPPRYFHLVVGRLTAAGQPDTSFGTGGTAVLTDPSGTVTSLQAGGLAVQPDGRIVIGTAGSTTATGVKPQQYEPAAVRLTAAGQFDPSFGTAGIALVGFPQAGSFGMFQSVSVLADGRVLLAGDVLQSSGAYVGGAARLTAAGQLDPSYGTAGVAVTAPFVTGSGGNPSGTPSLNTVIDSADRVVFDATSSPFNQAGVTDNIVFRLTAGGAVDTGFGTNGQVTVSSLPGLNTVGAGDLNLEPGLAVLPNGAILLGGTDQATHTGTGTTSGLIAELIGSNPPAGFVAATTGTITAGGPADGTFQVLNPTGGTYAAAGTVTAFPGFAGNVRVATADVNGDGTPDYIVGAGPGGAPEVTVYDGKTGTLLADFAAFESTFTGGVFVAAADFARDGRAFIVVTPDQGGGGRVVVYSVTTGGGATLLASFFGIDDPNFRGGARIAVGDVTHGGAPDLVVAAGAGGGPRVAVFTGTSVLAGTPARLVGDFFAFPGADAVNLRNGAFVAAGDVDGDGFADLVFGGGPGGAPRVLVLSGALVAAGNVAGADAAPLGNFFVAGNTSDRGGVRVAAVADGTGKVSVAAGSGAGDPARIRVYPGVGFTGGGEPGSFQDLTPFGGAVLPDGVYVG
ncbi:MAG TPA: hypothetical protein VH092_21245 [Urbifossiella sp.]|jgi:uncharacterized delta-60 repeat protein|nr:hypothetical protein [Urbifossiella sp.]